LAEKERGKRKKTKKTGFPGGTGWAPKKSALSGQTRNKFLLAAEEKKMGAELS